MKERDARKKFYELVVERFAFLPKELGSKMHERGSGAEHALAYGAGNATVELGFAYPELPFLVIVCGDGADAVRYRFVASKDRAAHKLRNRYYALVESDAPVLEALELAAAFVTRQAAAVQAALAALDQGVALRAPWSRH